jgi:membrane protein DedA with SNARE-associated domain
MARVGTGFKGVLVLAIALHLHHKVKGPAIDYVGLATASGASFFGLPGPGESVLIAAAVFAAKHKLDIASVVIVAFLGAAGGGILGWVIGLKAGRAVLTRPGPLHQYRLKALERGDALFARWTPLAIFLTPSWMAGIHNVGVVKYNTLNATIAAGWAAGIGVGAYFAGPPVVDAVSDLGTATGVILAVAVAAAVAGGILRRRRKGQAGEPAPARPD